MELYWRSQSNMSDRSTSFRAFIISSFFLVSRNTRVLHVEIVFRLIYTCQNHLKWHPLIFTSIKAACRFPLMYSFLMISLFLTLTSCIVTLSLATCACLLGASYCRLSTSSLPNLQINITMHEGIPFLLKMFL